MKVYVKNGNFKSTFTISDKAKYNISLFVDDEIFFVNNFSIINENYIYYILGLLIGMAMQKLCVSENDINGYVEILEVEE